MQMNKSRQTARKGRLLTAKGRNKTRMRPALLLGLPEMMLQCRVRRGRVRSHRMMAIVRVAQGKHPNCRRLGVEASLATCPSAARKKREQRMKTTASGRRSRPKYPVHVRRLDLGHTGAKKTSRQESTVVARPSCLGQVAVVVVRCCRCSRLVSVRTGRPSGAVAIVSTITAAARRGCAGREQQGYGGAQGFSGPGEQQQQRQKDGSAAAAATATGKVNFAGGGFDNCMACVSAADGRGMGKLTGPRAYAGRAMQGWC
ncbi:hypothetical protein IWX50DRAFT_353918 [Phyllosticta citricarpa]